MSRSLQFPKSAALKVGGFAGGLILLMAGCSHLNVKEYPSTANPNAEISRIQSEQETARSRQVNLLSPIYFKRSEQKLEEALEKRNNNAPNTAILKDLALAQANLEKAEEVSRLGRTTMEEVLEARTDALKAGAGPDNQEEKLKRTDRYLKEVAIHIEDGFLGRAERDRESLKRTYEDIEVEALKQSKIGHAKNTIATAKNEGAAANTPQTLKEAESAYADAEEYIEANRHNDAEIQARADQANAAADRALRFARESKIAVNKTSESRLLELEAEKDRVAAAQAAAAQKDEALSSERDSADALARTNERLAAENALNEQFEKLRSMFGRNEADVVRQGDKIVIVPVGQKFAKGRAVLNAKTRKVLDKIAQAYRDLGPAARINVAGHTDASGAAEVNQRLSEQRAESVRNYLVNKEAVPSDAVVASGHGEDMPVASNHSPKGRAANRRVEITVENIALAH